MILAGGYRSDFKSYDDFLDYCKHIDVCSMVNWYK